MVYHLREIVWVVFSPTSEIDGGGALHKGGAILTDKTSLTYSYVPKINYSLKSA
jgi:hypothetical protein